MSAGRRGQAGRPRVILRAALTLDGRLAEPAAAEKETREAREQVLADATAFAAEPARGLARLERGVSAVVCLGPAAAFRQLLEGGWVDELELTVLPRVSGPAAGGGAASATLSGEDGGDFFPAAIACELLQVEMRGGACWLRYRVRAPD